MAKQLEPLATKRSDILVNWEERAFEDAYWNEDSCKGIVMNSFDLHVSFKHEKFTVTGKKTMPDILERDPNEYINKYTRFGFYLSSQSSLCSVVELYDGSRGTNHYASIIMEIMRRISQTEDFNGDRSIIFHEEDSTEARSELTLETYESCRRQYKIPIHRIIWNCKYHNPANYVYRDKYCGEENIENTLAELLEKSPNKRLSPRTVEDMWKKLVDSCAHSLWSEYFFCKNVHKKAFMHLDCVDSSQIVYSD